MIAAHPGDKTRTNDLAGDIDCIGDVASQGAAEGAEIDHSTGLRPRERMAHAIAGGGTPADDLATGVHSHREAGAAAEGAKIDHPTGLRPRERMDGHIAGGVALADDLAVFVERHGEAGGAAQRTKVERDEECLALRPYVPRDRG